LQVLPAVTLVNGQMGNTNSPQQTPVDDVVDPLSQQSSKVTVVSPANGDVLTSGQVQLVVTTMSPSLCQFDDGSGSKVAISLDLATDHAITLSLVGGSYAYTVLCSGDDGILHTQRVSFEVDDGTDPDAGGNTGGNGNGGGNRNSGSGSTSSGSDSSGNGGWVNPPTSPPSTISSQITPTPLTLDDPLFVRGETSVMNSVLVGLLTLLIFAGISFVLFKMVGSHH
jgi:hypothetical protein